MKIAFEISLEDAKQRAKTNKLIRYGANTCWWAMDNAPWYNTDPINQNGLPCDPRKGMLFQTDKSLDFIRSAEQNTRHYGKYGIRTFLLALHGCVVTDDNIPTCFQTWEEYETLINEKEILNG